MTNRSFLTLSDDDKSVLLRIARDHIRVHLSTGKQLHIDDSAFSDALQQQTGSYVRLVARNKTRGHIGSLSATCSLIADVSQYAYDAAFEDPRFPVLTRDEESEIHIEITVLTPPEPLVFSTHQALLEQLIPNQDGIIINAGVHRAHFLPSAWQRFPDAEQFIATLKNNAGLETHYWSDQLTAQRFHTIQFSE